MFQLLNRFNLSLGRFFGILLTIHWTCTLVFIYLLCLNWNYGLAFAILFFIVFLHECGHCLAARFCGIFADSITLYPIGGVATLEIPSRPRDEILIALAGPFVNVVLIPGLAFLASLHPVLAYVAWANLALLVFNLLPLFPLDGGRVLRGCLVWCFGNRLKATTYAVNVAKVLCLILGAIGIVIGDVFLVAIVVLLWLAGRQEVEEVSLKNDIGPQSFVLQSSQMIMEMQEKMRNLDKRSQDGRNSSLYADDRQP